MHENAVHENAESDTAAVVNKTGSTGVRASGDASHPLATELGGAISSRSSASGGATGGCTILESIPQVRCALAVAEAAVRHWLLLLPAHCRPRPAH